MFKKILLGLAYALAVPGLVFVLMNIMAERRTLELKPIISPTPTGFIYIEAHFEKASDDDGTKLASIEPSDLPGVEPTMAPTVTPTATPVAEPTMAPTNTPTVIPTIAPSATPTPTKKLIATQTPEPTSEVEPTAELKKVPLGAKVDGLQFTVGEDGKTNVISFAQSGGNSNIMGTAIIENYDFSDFDIIVCYEIFADKNTMLVFKNCRFKNFTKETTGVVPFRFEKCRFESFSGANAELVECEVLTE